MFFILLLAPLFMGCDGLKDLSQQNLEADQRVAVVPLELVVKNIGREVTIPTVNQMSSDASELVTAVTQMCSELESKQALSVTELDQVRLKAQEKWKQMMMTFHRFELMQFGPVTNPLSTTMPSLYTFDTGNKCKVELLVSRNRKPDLSPADEDGYKLFGLDVYEHILFADPQKSLCERTRPGSWFEVTSLLERQKAMCGYLNYIGQELVGQATKLKNDWAITGGNFTNQILVDNALGPVNEAIGQISQALYFLYGEVSDLKLAVPAGIRLFNNRVLPARGCDKPCPNKAEHIPANFSIDALIAGLEGFAQLFNGIHPVTKVNGVSFDDLIIAQGRQDIVDGLNKALNETLINLRKLQGQTTIQELATKMDPIACKNTTRRNRLVELCAIRADVRAVTSQLIKSEVVLGDLLTKPRSQQGDND